jgi:pyruvate dehydrogenase E2 component (dihydrolipoamide acetyltransferase)
MATIIEMPKLSDTMTTGTLINWLKKEGDPVSSGDMIAEIETDKATMELEVFEDGFLLKQIIQAGAQVDVGAPIAAIGEKGEKVDLPEAKEIAEPAKEEPKKEEPVSTKEEAATPPPAQEETPEKATIENEEKEDSPEASIASTTEKRLKISPVARKLAAEKGIDPGNIQGSGPDGRILKEDILAAEKGGTSTSPSTVQTTAVTTLPGTPIAEEAAIPVSTMRGVIAKRLLESKTTIPHFYLEIEVDAAPLMALRAELNQRLAIQSPAQGSTKLSVTDFIIKAASEALRMVPAVNTSWMNDHVQQHSAVHMAVAVAVSDGLVTPKIENAHLKTLRQISSEVRDIAARAKEKKLKPSELSGSTFTISTLGMFGIENFFAIINPPNAAILAIGTIVKKPVVDENDNIVVGHRMRLGLSGDHRVVDGATGARYLAALKELLETPALMLA